MVADRANSIKDAQPAPAAREIAEQGAQVVDAIGRHSQLQGRAFAAESFTHFRRAELLEAGMQERYRGNAERKPHPAHGDQPPSRRRAQAFGGASAIGANETAGAEFDAAEPARDDDHDLVESLAVDRLQDRLAGSAGRFTVVVEAVLL